MLPSWAGSLLSPCPIDCPLRRFHSLDCLYLQTPTFKHPSFSTAAPIPSSHRLTCAAAPQLLLRARRVGRRIRLCQDLFGEIGGKHARFPVEKSLPPALLHLTQEQKPSGIFTEKIFDAETEISLFSTLQLPIHNQLLLSVAYPLVLGDGPLFPVPPPHIPTEKLFSPQTSGEDSFCGTGLTSARISMTSPAFNSSSSSC